MGAPPATIVIPVRRQVDAWLERSVWSALDQTTLCEVVVVTAWDTPSSNIRSLERLTREAPDRLRVVPEAQRGFPQALNTGIRAASAPRVGILQSDDWLDPNALETCLGFDADIVSAGSFSWHADGTTLIPEACLLSTPDGYVRCVTLERKAAYLQPLLLLRRTAVEACGGVDESLGDAPGLDDFDLIWTLLERGASVAVAGKSVYNYRDHPGERLTLGDRARMEATMSAILTKHGLSGDEHESVLAGHAKWFGRTLRQGVALHKMQHPL
jgi:hypothetical protein